MGTISSSRYPRRTCLEPFRHLLATHLLLSGESWEKKQQAAVISFRMGKADAEPPQYRACIAAKGCLETEFLGMVSLKIFDGRHWKCPPSHKRTVDVQHLIFKILSRMGCAAQEHLFLPHEQFPMKLLLILEDTDLGEAFVRTWETKKCMLDVLSAACIGKYKVAGFDDPEAKIVLQQVVQSIRMDIADIESRHASFRRVLKSVVQTHMLNKANMSAQVVCRSLAKRQQRAGGRAV